MATGKDELMGWGGREKKKKLFVITYQAESPLHRAVFKDVGTYYIWTRRLPEGRFTSLVLFLAYLRRSQVVLRVDAWNETCQPGARVAILGEIDACPSEARIKEFEDDTLKIMDGPDDKMPKTTPNEVFEQLLSTAHTEAARLRVELRVERERLDALRRVVAVVPAPQAGEKRRLATECILDAMQERIRRMDEYERLRHLGQLRAEKELHLRSEALKRASVRILELETGDARQREDRHRRELAEATAKLQHMLDLWYADPVAGRAQYEAERMALRESDFEARSVLRVQPY